MFFIRETVARQLTPGGSRQRSVLPLVSPQSPFHTVDQRHIVFVLVFEILGTVEARPQESVLLLQFLRSPLVVFGKLNKVIVGFVQADSMDQQSR